MAAKATEGYSGSDLMELCSQAAVSTVHELLRSRSAARGDIGFRA